MRISAVAMCLLITIAAQAAGFHQTASMGNGFLWNNAFWSTDGLPPAVVPTAGNTYTNTQYLTRCGGTFAGDSLTISGTGSLLMKGNGTVNLIVSDVLNISAALSAPILYGTVTGTDSIRFTPSSGRHIKLESQLLPGNTFTSIVVSAGADYTGAGARIDNGSNSFTGTWNVVRGRLQGLTAGSFGTGSFEVGSLGYLDFNYAYSNDTADLTIETGGMILLDQDLYFGSANLYGEELRAGTVWSGAQLKAHPIYGGAFDAASSDTATIAVAYPTGPRMEEVLAEFTFESAGSPASSDKSTYSTVTDWDVTYSDENGGTDLAVIQNTTFSPDWVSVQKANQTPPSAFDAYQAFTVTITGLAGGAVDLTSFSYRHSAAGHALGFNSTVFSSLTGFGNSDGLGGLPGTDGNFDTLVTIDLTGNDAFSRLIDGTVVEFRIALRDGSGANYRFHGLDDIVLTADVPMRGSIFGIY